MNLSRAILVFIFIACSNGASADDLDDGIAHFKKGNMEQAIAYFETCKDKNVNCVHNLGVSHYKLDHKDEAKEWFTLAARYGNQSSIKALSQNGWPIPQADLAHMLQRNNKQQSNNNDVTALELVNAILNSHNRSEQKGIEAYQQQNKTKNCLITKTTNITYDLDCQ
jgi:tetratricopeptide (TPR) repeat protein